MTCNVCKGTGFVNIHQIPEEEMDRIEDGDFFDDMEKWIQNNEDHEVQVCTCCGDGESWYGTPGAHYHGEEKEGAYDYNGGLAECH